MMLGALNMGPMGSSDPKLSLQDIQKTLPEIKREFRGVWVATVDNIDFPSKRTLSTDEQKAELIRIFNVCKAMNLNAVIFQIRPSADALYASKLEPWSAYLTGTQGEAPNPYYDPLAFAVEEAHKRGIELHCWFNPYRATHPAQKSPNAKSHISNTNPSAVRKYGTYEWMDPASPLVQKRSLDVMLDVVKRYDIDGVHIDDYFYPYPITDENKKKVPFPDSDLYAAYKSKGGSLGLNDWRRKNVDDFIEKLYKGIKSTKRWVKFGISPFGIYRPGYPEGIKAGIDQYDELYADALKWFEKGWCDYYTPQLYWPIAQTAQSYPKLYDWWLKQNKSNRHLWPGNYTGRTNPKDGNWQAQEVIDQIAITRKGSEDAGNIHFSMKAFLNNYNGIFDALKSGPYKEPALVPESRWLGDRKPERPVYGVSVDLPDTGPDKLRIVVKSDRYGQKTEEMFAYSVGTKSGSTVTWTPWDTFGTKEMVVTGKGLGKPTHVAVRAISKTGIASDPFIVELK